LPEYPKDAAEYEVKPVWQSFASTCASVTPLLVLTVK
jgi:hypothetical protein